MAIVGYFTTVAKAGDTWDLVAWRCYKRERMADIIIAANRKYIDTILFTGGEVLRIPVVDEVADTKTLPPWRR